MESCWEMCNFALPDALLLRNFAVLVMHFSLLAVMLLLKTADKFA